MLFGKGSKMTGTLLKTKPIGGSKHLNLESYVAGTKHYEFGAREVYLLHLSYKGPGMWSEREKTGGGQMFVTTPDAYVVSRAAYEVLFDLIDSKETFDKLRDEI